MFCEIKIFNFIHNKHYRTLFIILSSNLHAFLSSRLHIIQVTSSPHHIVFQSSCHHVSTFSKSPRLLVSQSPQSPQSSNLDFNSSTPNLIHSSTYPLINYPYFVFNILEHKLVLDVHINKFCY